MLRGRGGIHYGESTMLDLAPIPPWTRPPPCNCPQPFTWLLNFGSGPHLYLRSTLYLGPTPWIWSETELQAAVKIIEYFNKCYSQSELNPGPLTLMPSIATVWAISLFSRITRAWLYLKVLKLTANMKLAHTVACKALKLEALGSSPTGHNILILDFLFSSDSVESTECISI